MKKNPRKKNINFVSLESLLLFIDWVIDLIHLLKKYLFSYYVDGTVLIVNFLCYPNVFSEPLEDPLNFLMFSLFPF